MNDEVDDVLNGNTEEYETLQEILRKVLGSKNKVCIEIISNQKFYGYLLLMNDKKIALYDLKTQKIVVFRNNLIIIYGVRKNE